MTERADAIKETGARPWPYQAYLIRCWQEGTAWRFSLEGIGAEHQRRGFSRLEDLAAFIEQDLTRHEH